MADPTKRSALHSRWLSQDFVEWDNEDTQDVVIVGSGYGAAMAAHTWAGRTDSSGEKLRMVLLERGRERLPGSFASTLDELPGDVRLSRAGKAPIGRRDALFDVRLAGDVSALVANGLGGGSLINAGVMVEPSFGRFDSRLPPGVEADLQANWFARAKALLGGSVGRSENTMDRHADVSAHGPLKKTAALQLLAGEAAAFRLAPVTVRMAPSDNTGEAVNLATCTLCGDCLTGCNVGAKISLDTHLLLQAQRAGLRIFTSASVLRLKREAGLWSIEVVHTDPQVQGRRDQPVFIKAHKVVLAAGSLGSTEILLRSRRHSRRKSGLPLSPRLGEQFSLNGDNIASIAFPHNVNAAADEALPLAGPEEGVSPRRVGPEITGMLSWPSDDSGPGFLVQEFSVPSALRGFFHEIVTTRGWAERWSQWDGERHNAARSGQRDPLAIDRESMSRELLVGLIGHDSANGRVELPRENQEHVNEGSVRVKWPDVSGDPAMADAFGKLERRVEKALGKQARVTPNPLWRLLPDALGSTVGNAPGGAMTVHPLGGCPMGVSAMHGVVNEWGAVFQEDGHDDDAWEGSLLVLDGAVVPASLGANPALTISALSLRAAHKWQSLWGWVTAVPPPANPVERPRARSVADCLPTQAVASTQVQIVERLWGRVDWLKGPTGREPRVVELTFAFEPRTVDELTQPLHKRLWLAASAATPAGTASRLRIYRWCDWTHLGLDVASDEAREAYAEVSAPLNGHMDLLERMPTWGYGRALLATLAFVRNRGGRDLMNWWRSQPLLKPEGAPLLYSALDKARDFQRLFRRISSVASQAGEKRHFLYLAQVAGPTGRAGFVGPPTQDEFKRQQFWNSHLLDAEIQGDKRFTYARGENPWNQLLYLNLRFLGRGLLPRWWWPVFRPASRLKLDARFLAGQGLPLLRITQQANQVRALTDLAHLGLYWSRLFLKLHLWHLRSPDPPTEGRPQRLPGYVQGLPAPEITDIDLEPPPSNGDERHHRAVVRLTRYRGQQATSGIAAAAPLIFIHGYSASGTTFAHDAIEHHAAGHFWPLGRDIWILDLRTSAGMPTAREPWAFEDAAWADIPVAIEHIAQLVKRERDSEAPVQVDVFAHCIGAVMLSMALLGEPNAAPQKDGQPTRYRDELERLPGHIRKLVLSQKSFFVEYTDANILRSYLINFFKNALAGGYSFRPPPLPRLHDRLYDAFLNTLPYPPDEWPVEHPWFARVPWSTTRRRMDALYERTFNIRRMPPAVLRHIDDFFGPLNLETVAQVIHLARRRQITRKDGTLMLTEQKHINRWPVGGTLLLSAQDSGMVNPHTSHAMQCMLQSAGIAHQRELLRGGHQDVLIGHGAQDTWRRVEAFLDA
jgi:choline dehydrogenase-like flavoprotein